MKINYADQKVMVGEAAIFLAGPTIRGQEITAWRIQALAILKKLQYSGIVYIPEYLKRAMLDDEDFIKQAEWEREALTAATMIVFWIPRDLDLLPGFTTNVEFGYWLHSGKVIYGRPQEAVKVRYLDWLYFKECNARPFTSLEVLLKATLQKL